MRHWQLFGLCLLGMIVGCTNSESTPNSTGPGKPAAAKGVILLRYTQGSESTEQREQGFLETLKKDYPQINILSDDQYSGTTPESSLEKAQQLLLKYGDRVEGIFAVCEPNANGVLGALEQAGLAGKVKFVGFDPNERMVTALGERKMEGIVLQDPVKMGELAVKTMVQHLEGKDNPDLKIAKRISTGEYIATPENMKGEEMNKLLNPPQQDSDVPKGEKKKYRIAVIPKGTTHEFWKSVHFGAQKAAAELGNVEVIWKGPHQESDRDAQVSLVQSFITNKVDGICLAPLDKQTLVAPVKEAKAAGIPTVIFDSDLDDKDSYVSYVATDNYVGGVLAAKRLAETLGAK